jgi:hypothetical protein
MGEPACACNFVNMILISPVSDQQRLLPCGICLPAGWAILVRMTNQDTQTGIYMIMLLAHLPHTGSAVQLALPRLVSDCHPPRQRQAWSTKPSRQTPTASSIPIRLRADTPASILRSSRRHISSAAPRVTPPPFHAHGPATQVRSRQE